MEVVYSSHQITSILVDFNDFEQAKEHRFGQNWSRVRLIVEEVVGRWASRAEVMH